jgi:lysine-specific permease
MSVGRKLLPRHLNMIAIGGTIGTGLFIGGGAALAYAGPLGALIGLFSLTEGYSIVSILVYAVVTSIGEMACFRPTSGSFNSYAGMYVDPALAFALGWNYWLQWAITLPSELSAAALLISYWYPDSPMWIWSMVILFILMAVHLIGVRVFTLCNCRGSEKQNIILPESKSLR